MPNDLEEFLRQAAAMRQRKATEQRAETQRQREQQAQRRPNPYTRALQERLVDAAQGEGEAVLGIEINDDEHEHSPTSSTSPPNEHSAGIRKGRSEVHRSENRASTASELRDMLRRPDGVRHAFLFREILNRPRF